MGAYAPLHAWLVGTPPYVNNIPVTFEQIEGILGFQLPATARRKAQWWENNATGHIQARSWLDAGFLTQGVNIPNETLTFTRG
jgi:hypothetical protein